jgi:hypothetical protein
MASAIICTRGSRRRRHQRSPTPPPGPVLIPEVDREYVVLKYWTGPFRGRLLELSSMGSLARFVVTDAMRPGPLIEDKCSFPECILADLHDGDHEFSPDLRNGVEIELRLSHVQLKPAA